VSKTKIKRKKSRKDRLREIAQQDEFTEQSSRIYDFVEKNWRGFLAILGLLLLIAAAQALVLRIQAGSEKRAAEALYQVEKDLPLNDFGTSSDLEEDELEEALASLATVIDAHGKSNAGRMARLQSGIMLLESGRSEEALGQFAAVKSGKDLLGIRALLGEAAALESLERTAEAADKIRAARGATKGEEWQLLTLELGRLLESNGDAAGAIKVYQDLVSKYPDSAHVSKAEKRLNRLEGKGSDGAASSD
jgi:TolA-binding protein